MNHPVFVYGTLRKHEANHHLLSNAAQVAEQAWTNGKLVDTGLSYPALLNHPYATTFGELYEVDEETLSRLDLLEGYAGQGQVNLYDRVLQTVHTDQGITQAFVYKAGSLLAHFEKEITSGEWKVENYLQENETFLYFAYGSCMDTHRFKRAGVDHYFNKVIGKGVLHQYRLGFTRHAHDGGRADIIEAPGNLVEGKVYLIPKAALDYLYRREGVTSGCYRPTLVDLEVSNKRCQNVLTFTVVDKQADIAPPEHYAEELRRGGKDVLSPAYFLQLEQLIHSLRQKENQGGDAKWAR